MTLLYVTVTGSLGPAAAGARVFWTPTGWLTDATDLRVFPPAPLPPVTIAADGTFASGPLLAQDSTGPQPAGEAWQVLIEGIDGVAPLSQTYTILHANGAVQDLSTLLTAVPSPQFTTYLLSANNLTDLPSPSAARTALQLGSAATQPTSAFDAAGAASAAQAAAIAASLPTMAVTAVSASGALAIDKVTQVTAASNLTMTLPAPVAGALIVVEREAASTGTVTISGSMRGAAGTVTLLLSNESEMFLGTASTWDPVAGHKTLGSLDARYTGRPAAAEKTYFVSAASYASDSNDGLTVPTAKATIAGALADLAGHAGVIQVGVGTFPLTAADSSGNGITLPATEVILRGCGAPTVISLQCAVTWGILCQGPLSQVNDLVLQVAAAGSCTYGVGVDTPTASGSAEGTTFSGVTVQNPLGGSLANGFGVGPSHAASSSVDISGTVFANCTASAASAAGFLIGNGTSGNILNTHMYGCESVGNAWGVRLAAGDVTWYGGNLGENTTSDIRVESSNGAPVVFSGFRSEDSARLLSASAVSAAAAVSVRDVTWITDSAHVAAAGDVINWSLCGTLTLDSVQVLVTAQGGPPTVVPVFIVVGNSGQLVVAASGLSASAPLATLFSGTPSGNASVTVRGFAQLTAAGGFAAASIPGPVRLGPSNIQTSYNGTVRDTLSPTETQRLASAGAVTIAGICDVADITLAANATSSSVTALYLGQKITIAWRQDSTGNRTYAWPATCKFRGGTPPSPSTAANAVDAVTFWFDGSSLIQA